MFNMTRIHHDHWEEYLDTGLKQFIGKQPEGWSPELNDQDVFNAVFTSHPQLVLPLPCEWNLQVGG
jgi:hypothetical protein